MRRRETVVFSGDDVVQLVERIAVGHPGLAFLVGLEEVAGAVEGERVGHADAGGDGLKLLRAGIPLLDGAALVPDVVERDFLLRIALGWFALLDEPGLFLGLEILPPPQAIGVGVVGDEKGEVGVALPVQRHCAGIDSAAGDIRRGPAGGDDFFGVGFTVPVAVAEERHLALRRDVESARAPCHADGNADG